MLINNFVILKHITTYNLINVFSSYYFLNKKNIWLLLLLFTLNGSFGLCQISSGSASDTLGILQQDSLARGLMYSEPAKAMAYAQNGYRQAKELGYVRGQARCLNRIATLQRLAGNYPRALAQHLEALEIAENAKDTDTQTRILLNIGNLFYEQDQLAKAYEYYGKAKQLLHFLKNPSLEEGTYTNLGSYFAKIGSLDSARHYTHKAYELSKRKKSLTLGTILLNLGNVSFRKGQYKEALMYFGQSEVENKAKNDFLNLADVYLEEAQLYQKIANNSSSKQKALQALQLAQQQGNYSRIHKASLLLNTLLEGENMPEAYRYFKLAIAAKDSIMSQAKVQQLQNLVISENFRQQEIENEKIEAESRRTHNIQLIGIAVFVITFLLFVVLLTRGKSHPRLLDHLGTVSLLLFFEFLSLMIHPFLEKITNHSPILMLLGLVVVSSILVPLHHKLTNWLKVRLSHKLIQKAG
jgi:tetratricopeptide (TPR) repeat protein